MRSMQWRGWRAALRQLQHTPQGPPTARTISSITKDTRLGIVGCGNVGKTVTENLVRSGFKVVSAYDPVQARLDALPAGIAHRTSPRQVTEDSDILISGLPMPEHVAQAAEGPDGILAGLTKDKVWVDHSTTDYNNTLRYAEEATNKGAHVLEAPITGGMAALQKGTMTVYIGGDKKVADAIAPMLEASYIRTFYVGKIGSATVLKVVSNMLTAANLVSSTEVLMLAKKADIDLKRFWEGVRLSCGQSFVWDTGMPFVMDGTYDPSFTIKLFCKDMQLGFDMARKYKVAMDIHQHILSIYRKAQYQYGDDAPCYITAKALEEAMGVSLADSHFEKWTYENEVVNGGIVVKHSQIEEGYGDEQ